MRFLRMMHKPSLTRPLPEPASGDSRPYARRQVVICLLAIVQLLVLLVYLPALSARASTFDDQEYLYNNRLVKNPSWDSARRFLSEVMRPSTVPGYYQPMAMLSLMADYALAGRSDHLMPFHRTSLLFHIANTVLVGILLYQLLHEPWIAAAVALIFGVHPMTTDSICWVSERKTVLAAFFALCSLILYVSFAQRGRTRWTYAGSIALYTLALMSKPTSIPLPFIMLLLDCWPLRRMSLRVVWEKLPHLAIGAAFGGITYFSQAKTAGVILPGRGGVMRSLLIFCHDVIFYMGKAVWPARVSAYYPSPAPLTGANPRVLASVLLAVVLLVLLFVTLRRTHRLFIGAMIFVMGVLPTTGIIGFTDVLVANRFLYLPSLGFLIILGVLLERLWRTSGKYGAQRHMLAAVIVVSIVGVETVCTRQYVAVWDNTVSLYEHMVNIAPSAPAIHNDLGNAFSSRGELDRAIHHFREALRVDPQCMLARTNLGSAFMNQKKLKQAIRVLERGVRMAPQYAPAYNALATALEMDGKTAEAILHYHWATELDPYFVGAHYNLAMSLLARGYTGEAIASLRQATRVDPEFLLAFKDLAWLLATHPDSSVRNPGEAIALANHAAKRITPSDPTVLNVLAAAHAANGDFVQATKVAVEALRLTPKSNPELAGKIRENLRLYQNGRAHVENPAKRVRSTAPSQGLMSAPFCTEHRAT